MNGYFLSLVLDELGHLKVFPKEMEKDCNDMKDKEHLHMRRLGREVAIRLSYVSSHELNYGTYMDSN